jgi:hypothetical protein
MAFGVIAIVSLMAIFAINLCIPPQFRDVAMTEASLLLNSPVRKSCRVQQNFCPLLALRHRQWSTKATSRHSYSG